MSDLFKQFVDIHVKGLGFTAGKEVGGKIIDKVIGSNAYTRFLAAEAVSLTASAIPAETFTGQMMRHAAAGCLAHAGAGITETLMNDSGLLSDIIHVLDPEMALKDAVAEYDKEKAAGSVFNHSDYADPNFVDPAAFPVTQIEGDANAATVAGIAGPPVADTIDPDKKADGFPKGPKEDKGGNFRCPKCGKSMKRSKLSKYVPDRDEVLDEETRLWTDSTVCGECKTHLNGANHKALADRRKAGEKDEKQAAAESAKIDELKKKKDEADAVFQDLIEQEDVSKKSLDMAEGMLEQARKEGKPEPFIKVFEKNVEDMKLSHSEIQNKLVDISAVIESLEEPLMAASNAAANGSPNAKNISDKLPGAKS